MLRWLLICMVPQQLLANAYPMFTSPKGYSAFRGYPATAALIPVALPLAASPPRRYMIDYEDQESEYPLSSYPLYNPVEEISNESPATWTDAEANLAFLQNLILAQMYQDAVASAAVSAGAPARLTRIVDSDASDSDRYVRPWMYGIATTDTDDKSRAQEIFREDDSEVNELETLRKKEEAKKKKEKEAAKTTTRKQRLNKTVYTEQQQQKKSIDQSISSTSAGSNVMSNILPSSGRHHQEFVLQQPNILTVSRGKLFHRSVGDDKPSVYQTIKKLLTMEDELKKEPKMAELGDKHLQKRFISTDEQLASELHELSRRRISM